MDKGEQQEKKRKQSIMQKKMTQEFRKLQEK